MGWRDLQEIADDNHKLKLKVSSFVKASLPPAHCRRVVRTAGRQLGRGTVDHEVPRQVTAINGPVHHVRGVNVQQSIRSFSCSATSCSRLIPISSMLLLTARRCTSGASLSRPWSSCAAC
eukprot:762627-Hanusia_phi.AAC.2